MLSVAPIQAPFTKTLVVLAKKEIELSSNNTTPIVLKCLINGYPDIFGLTFVNVAICL